MKDIKQRIEEIRRNNLSIEQTGYLNGNADLVGESEFIKALIEEIIKPIAKEAFEAGVTEGAANSINMGGEELDFYRVGMVQDAWINLKFGSNKQ